MKEFEKEAKRESRNNVDEETAFESLSEVLSEELQEEVSNTTDPFERYCLLLRLSLINKTIDYGHDVFQGYQVLIKELQKEQEDNGENY